MVDRKIFHFVGKNLLLCIPENNDHNILEKYIQKKGLQKDSNQLSVDYLAAQGKYSKS